MKKFITYSDYDAIGKDLVNSIGNRSYFCGGISTYIGDESALLNCSLIVYRDEYNNISDISLVWFECHWYDSRGIEMENYFSFAELKKHIIWKAKQ